MTRRAALLAALGSLAIRHRRKPTCARARSPSTTGPPSRRRTPRPYTVRIYQSDHGLNLTIRPGHVVAMSGYLGEPVFRLDRTGLWVNAASPTAVVVGLVKKDQRVAASGTHWRLERGRTSVAWHDSRVQRLPAGVDRGAWSIPLTVDGRPARLTGELVRFARPSLALWLGLTLCVGALGGAAVARCTGATSSRAWRPGLRSLPRRRRSWSSSPSPSTPTPRRAPGSRPSTRSCSWWSGSASCFAVRRTCVMGGAVGVGLVSLAVGLLDGAVLLHPIVLAVLPGTIVRLGVAIAVGAGSGRGRARLPALRRWRVRVARPRARRPVRPGGRGQPARSPGRRFRPRRDARCGNGPCGPADGRATPGVRAAGSPPARR